MKTIRFTQKILRPKRGVVIAGLAALLLTVSFNAYAVNEAEMDQARAIAAKWYLRYINNGSDYLDNLNPTSMSDLEGQLKQTEQENIKKFKAVSTPSNYSSWNKEDLVAYWGTTFFKEGKALDPKGQDNAWIKSRVTSSIKNNVTVKSTPVPTAAPEPEAAPEETPAPVAEPEVPAQVPVQQPTQTYDPYNLEEVTVDNPNADLEAQEAAEAENTEEAIEEAEKKGSSTWVYVMILCILVAIVIALVVYASKTMKGQNRRDAEDEDTYDPGESTRTQPLAQERKRSSIADDTGRRERFAEALAVKTEEIRTLNRRISDLEADNETLREENRRLRAEAESHRYRRTERTESSEERERYGAGTATAAKERTIYLGRANSKGLFVRADRHAIEGQSIFKLTTTDGSTGTFTLIDNPVVEEQILDDPGRWAAGGCFAKDIFDTEGRYRVVMETPGKAVFEDGAWRVERKARIRYE